MIAMLGLMLAGGPTLLGFTRPEITEVGFAAAIRLPELSARDRQMLGVVARVLVQGTNQYTVREALNVTDGRTIRCDVLPESLLIRFAVSPGEVRSGAGLMTSLLREGAFRQDHIDAAISSLARREQDPWSRAVLPGRFGIVKATRDEVLKLYLTVFRPEAVTVACVAPKGDAMADLWDNRFLGWKGREPFRYPSQSAPLGPLPRPSDVSVIELTGKPTKSLADSLLALYALGAGKDSTLFRIVREKMGLSYRQESLLWPSDQGWIPRLLVANSSLPEPETVKADMRKEMLADVDVWGESTRKRALGMAAANLQLGLPIGPLYLGPRPFAGYAEDLAAFSAFMHMKTGESLTPEILLDRLQGVSLEQMKATAQAMLQP